VGIVAGVYIYVSDTPFNHCVAMYEKDLGHTNSFAVNACLERMKDK